MLGVTKKARKGTPKKLSARKAEEAAPEAEAKLTALVEKVEAALAPSQKEDSGKKEDSDKCITFQGRVIPRKVFSRLVKEIAQDLYTNGTGTAFCNPWLKWEKEAISTLHEDAELYLMEIFQRSQGVATAFGKTTLRVLIP